MSCVVLLTLELITPLFKYTPNAILASIIITAVIGLIDFDSVFLIWKIDKFDFVACVGAFFGVIFISVEIGLLIAVSISFAKILLQVTRSQPFSLQIYIKSSFCDLI
ncbi:Sulfate transporter 1.1 [Thalictrum thalictroides]|uniref:Sulfate transporter 1.1 n=1 Tax=Thalictrum thalictroides TaxID=46969 RepID=A0A7J6WB36_THATH|nr:Sulfate transporter 1.1 [Thalictrum thalictroides]